jgi:hypothetical protein
MVATSGNGWVLAPALKLLVEQLDDFDAARNRASDGSIGDARHQAESYSDHNPRRSSNGVWYVTAVDISNAPWLDDWITDVLTKDTRVKYLIRRRRYWQRIAWSRSDPLQRWVPYGGSNPHDHHVHISLRMDAIHDLRRWVMPGRATTPATPTAPEDDMSWDEQIVNPKSKASMTAKARLLDVETKVGNIERMVAAIGRQVGAGLADLNADHDRIEAELEKQGES